MQLPEMSILTLTYFPRSHLPGQRLWPARCYMQSGYGANDMLLDEVLANVGVNSLSLTDLFFKVTVNVSQERSFHMSHEYSIVYIKK